jgi:hypothetical protein
MLSKLALGDRLGTNPYTLSTSKSAEPPITHQKGRERSSTVGCYAYNKPINIKLLLSLTVV